jgi:hypothetical protein
LASEGAGEDVLSNININKYDGPVVYTPCEIQSAAATGCSLLHQSNVLQAPGVACDKVGFQWVWHGWPQGCQSCCPVLPEGHPYPAAIHSRVNFNAKMKVNASDTHPLESSCLAQLTSPIRSTIPQRPAAPPYPSKSRATPPLNPTSSKSQTQSDTAPVISSVSETQRDPRIQSNSVNRKAAWMMKGANGSVAGRA